MFYKNKPMTLDEYQKEAMVTDTGHVDKIYPALGLASEAGEVAGCVKKILRGDFDCDIENISPEIKERIGKELGGCLWYIACLASDFGYSLNEIGKLNINQLRDRQKRGTLKGDGDDR